MMQDRAERRDVPSSRGTPFARWPQHAGHDAGPGELPSAPQYTQLLVLNRAASARARPTNKHPTLHDLLPVPYVAPISSMTHESQALDALQTSVSSPAGCV